MKLVKIYLWFSNDKIKNRIKEIKNKQNKNERKLN